MCSNCQLFVTYCPRQATMGTCSSSKNWGWAVARKRCLNDSTIPMQVPTSDAKLAVRGYWIDLLVALPMLRQRQPDSGESFIVLEYTLTHSLAAKLLSVCHLQYVNFVLQVKNAACEWGYGRVCVKLWCQMSWCLKRISLSDVLVPSHSSKLYIVLM